MGDGDGGVGWAIASSPKLSYSFVEKYKKRWVRAQRQGEQAAQIKGNNNG